MDQPCLVFIDIDGTLIGHDHRVPDSAVSAISAARTAGHRLFLCSGRSHPEIYPRLRDLGFEGEVAGGGAFVRLGEETLLDERILRAEIDQVEKILAACGAIWVWQGPEAICPGPKFMATFLEMVDHTVAEPAWKEYSDSIAPYVRDETPESTSKLTAYLPADVEISAVAEQLPPSLRIIPGSISAAATHVVEIMPTRISKGSAIAFLANHVGVPMERTIAIGDSHNDIEALEMAGIGVAMGQAPPEVQQAANMVTTAVDDNGLARAFTQLGLADIDIN